jgi:hypothetical protein
LHLWNAAVPRDQIKMNHTRRAKISTGSASHLFLQQAICTNLRPEAPWPALHTLGVHLVQRFRFAGRHTISTETAVRHTEIHFWKSTFPTLNQALGTDANAVITARAHLQKAFLNRRPGWAQSRLYRLLPHPPTQQPDSRRIKRRIDEIFESIKHTFCFVSSSILPQVTQRFCIYHQRVNPGVSFQNQTKLLPISAWKWWISLPFPAAKKLTHHAQ